MKISVFLRQIIQCMGILLCASIAYAETSPNDCEKEPACMALYQRAAELSKQGNLAEAHQMYEMAYSLRADPRLIFSIARLLHKQGKLSEAAFKYEVFLNSSVNDLAQKAKARAYLDEIQQSVPPPPLQPSEKTVTQPSVGTASAAGSLSTPLGNSQPVSQPQPVYKKWWFWTALSAVTVGAVAVGLGVGLSRPEREVFSDVSWR